MNKIQSVLILGAGAWGAALAQTLSHNCVEVLMYDKQPFDSSKPHSKLNLNLAKNIKVITDFNDIGSPNAVFLVLPSHALISVAKLLKGKINNDTPLVICTKGIDGINNQLYSESLIEIFGSKQTIAVLSGPNFAIQLANENPTVTTIACKNPRVATMLKQLCTTYFFKIEIISDIAGIQIVGGYKNIMAMVIGFLKAKQISDNTIARFMTAAISEILIIFKHFNASPATLLASCGIGDIFLTCTSCESRNFTFGQQLAKHKRALTILENNKTTVEAVKAIASFYNIAKQTGLTLKVVEVLHKILYQNKMIDNSIINELI